MNDAGTGRDVDLVLTTREFVRMLRAEHIRPDLLESTPLMILLEKRRVLALFSV